MLTLSQHRTLRILFLGTLVILLARPITILLVGLIASSPSTSPVLAAPMSRQILKVMHVPADVKPLIKRHPQALAREMTGLPMSGMGRDYTCFISGKTLCATEPCLATLKISLTSDESQEAASVTVQSNEDGTYWIQVPFKALPDHSLDWKISADSPDGLSGEIHGRQILSADTRLDVSQNITLR